MQSCVWSRLLAVRHKISCIWPGSRQRVLLLLPLKLFFFKDWKLCDWMRREPKCPGPRRMVPQLPCKQMQMSCLGALVVSDGNLQAGKGYGAGILEVPVAATNPGGFITDPTFLGKPAAWERAWIAAKCDSIWSQWAHVCPPLSLVLYNGCALSKPFLWPCFIAERYSRTFVSSFLIRVERWCKAKECGGGETNDVPVNWWNDMWLGEGDKCWRRREDEGMGLSKECMFMCLQFAHERLECILR